MKKILLSALLFSVCISNVSCAASFDCAKASSATEKLICNNEAISKLDEQLASSYKQALENTTDKDALKKSQVEWLKQQRACKDVECLTQVYKTRIYDLSENSETIVSNSSDVKKLKFRITKGQQYEVCRVFNDYLNSQYYKQGDCFIKDYPVDKRLRSPEFTKTDIKPYEDQEIAARLIGKNEEVKERYIKGIKRINTENVRTAWLANVDISNSGTRDNILFNIRHESTEDAKALICPVFQGVIDLLVDNKIDDRRWAGALTWSPFLFDGRTFLTNGEGSVYQVYEPRLLRVDENYDDINHQGNLYLNFICNLDAN